MTERPEMCCDPCADGCCEREDAREIGDDLRIAATLILSDLIREASMIQAHLLRWKITTEADASAVMDELRKITQHYDAAMHEAARTMRKLR